MDNPFKKMESKEKAPEELKEKVMASVNLSQMIINLSELFVGKMGPTAGDLFLTNKKK